MEETSFFKHLRKVILIWRFFVKILRNGYILKHENIAIWLFDETQINSI